MPQETTRSVEVESVLTPEQQEKAAQLTVAMAEKFGVSSEDFSVLNVETEAGAGEVKHMLAYTAGNGIHKGSWNRILDKKNRDEFIIEIDGVVYDTRTGMTGDTYVAMYDASKLSGFMLPDRTYGSQPQTSTLLTGEQADDRGAPFANVHNGEVNRVWYGCDYDHQSVRFRPAVVIE